MQWHYISLFQHVFKLTLHPQCNIHTQQQQQQHQGVTSNVEFFKAIDDFESVGQIVVVEAHTLMTFIIV